MGEKRGSQNIAKDLAAVRRRLVTALPSVEYSASWRVEGSATPLGRL
jgi:hypothetical protein